MPSVGSGLESIYAAVVCVGCIVSPATPQAPLGSPPPLQLPRSASGMPHEVSIEETLALREVTDLALSPDGKRVAFILQQARPDRNAYASAIFIASADQNPKGVRKAVKLADVADATAVQWTADGAGITYVAPVRGVRQVWRMPAARGTPLRLTHYSAGIGTGLAAERVTDFPPYGLSPDGHYLAYLTWDTVAAVRAARERARRPFVFDESSTESTLDVLRGASWRQIPLHTDLWLKDMQTGHVQRVWQSPGTMLVSPSPAGTIPPELAWSPDSRSIALVYYPVLQPGRNSVRHLGLYAISARSFRPLLDDIGWTLYPRWLPDGQGLVIWSEGRLRSEQARYWPTHFEYRFADSSLRAVAAPTDIASQAQRALEAQMAGRATHCSVSANQRRVACLFETPAEIAVADLPGVLDGGVTAVIRPHTITSLNPEWRSIRIGDVSQLTWSWPGAAGDHPSATLVKPVDYRAGRRYPLLVMLYNQGEKNRFVAQAWTNWPVQAFAAKGYAVLLVNFPARAFTPGDFEAAKWAEAEGPVASVDSAVQRAVAMGIADTSRMGILGWSWGSYVTSYLISHYPGRFQVAASSEGQIFNIASYWMEAGEVRAFTASAVAGGPYPRFLNQWMQLSPTMSADRVKIPVLQEYRTGNPGGFEFNAAVTSQGGAAEMVFYPDEVHVFQGPRNRLHSMHLNYDWFNFWLLNEEDPSPTKRAQYERWRVMRGKLRQPHTIPDTVGAQPRPD